MKECTEAIKAESQQNLEAAYTSHMENVVVSPIASKKHTDLSSLERFHELSFGEAFETLSRDDIGFLR